MRACVNKYWKQNLTNPVEKKSSYSFQWNRLTIDTHLPAFHLLSMRHVIYYVTHEWICLWSAYQWFWITRVVPVSIWFASVVDWLQVGWKISNCRSKEKSSTYYLWVWNHTLEVNLVKRQISKIDGHWFRNRWQTPYIPPFPSITPKHTTSNMNSCFCNSD